MGKYSQFLSFFTTQRTTDGRTHRPPTSQCEFGRMVKPPVDLDVLATDHAGAAVNWNVQELYGVSRQWQSRLLASRVWPPAVW